MPRSKDLPHGQDGGGRQQAAGELQRQGDGGAPGVGADHPSQEADECPRTGRAFEEPVRF